MKQFVNLQFESVSDWPVSNQNKIQSAQNVQIIRFEIRLVCVSTASIIEKLTSNKYIVKMNINIQISRNMITIYIHILNVEYLNISLRNNGK